MPVPGKRGRKKRSASPQKPIANASVSAQEFYVNGQRAYYQGNYEEALENFRLSGESDSQFMEPRVALGKVFLETGQYDRAVKTFVGVLRNDSSYFTAYVALGQAYLSKKEYDQAFDALKKALTLLPHHPEVEEFLEIAREKSIDEHMAVGEKKKSLGDINGAKTEFQKVLRLDPQKAEAHLHLAHILINQKKYPAAKDHLEKALAKEPMNTDVLSLLGKTLYRTGYPQEARKVYKRLLDIDPSNEDARIHMETIQKALYIDPHIPPPFYELSSSLQVTRGDLAAILVIGLKDTIPAEQSEEPVKLGDIKKHWAGKYIQKAVNTGLMEPGTQSAFAPDSLATRGELARIVYRILTKIDPTARNEVKGVLNPYHDIRPDNSLYQPVLYLRRTMIMKGEERHRFGIDSKVPGIEALEVVDRLDNYLSRLGEGKLAKIPQKED